MRELTYAYLLECLNYDSEAGDLIWRCRPKDHFKDNRAFKTWNAKFSNKIAGTINKVSGYVFVSIRDKPYLAHRLCWFHHKGYIPEGDIDHKNRVRHHNWILNLREVSRQCNVRNSGISKNNTSGVTGVGLHKKSGKWQGQITVNKKNINLDYFKLFDDAVRARWDAEIKYKFPNCCTSSTAYNYLKNKNLI